MHIRPVFSGSVTYIYTIYDITRVALFYGFVILVRFISTSYKLVFKSLVSFSWMSLKKLRAMETLGRHNLQKNIMLRPPRILNSSSACNTSIFAMCPLRIAFTLNAVTFDILLHVIHNTVDPLGLSFCFLLGGVLLLPTGLSRFLSLDIY